MPDITIGQTAKQVTDDALRVLQAGGDVIIRAHAGAGKTGGRSSGTIRMAAAIAGTGARVALIVAQNDQLVETLGRLTGTWRNMTTTFVPAASTFREMPDWVRRRTSRPPNLAVAESGTPARTVLTSRPGLFVLTAAKFSFLAPTTAGTLTNRSLTPVAPFDVVIVDEAWMTPAAMWPRLSALACQVALVGDRGQIMPWLPDSEFYPGMLGSPVESLPDLVARERASTVVEFELPVTRRNPSHTTAITGRLPACGSSPTRPMFDANEVPLTLGATPLRNSPIDEALARMTADGVALDRLPIGLAAQADPLVADACAQAAARLLTLGATLGHPGGDRPLTPDQVAVLVAHHDQKAAVVHAMAAAGLSGPAPRVATFNTIQGATIAVSIVWHPLSGRADVSAFHADAGRLTVGLTRHTHGCLLVSRDGVGDRLVDAPVCDDLEGDAVDGRFAGLRAHTLIWEHLAA